MEAITERLEPQPTVTHHLALDYGHEPLVRRLQEKEHMTEQVARSLFEDMKKFLLLCGTTRARLAPSEPIDTAWHNFILFTKDYQEFCQRFFGRFLHHHPRVEGDPADPEVVPRTLELARATFGELSPNWRYAKADGTCDSCGFSDCTKCSGSTSCSSDGVH